MKREVNKKRMKPEFVETREGKKGRGKLLGWRKCHLEGGAFHKVNLFNF